MSAFVAQCPLCGEVYMHIFVGAQLLSGHFRCGAEFPLVLHFATESGGKGVVVVEDAMQAQEALAWHSDWQLTKVVPAAPDER